jgi:hypothetical protein
MIHQDPECLARFDGDKAENLAELDFLARFPSGECRPVMLILGYPFIRKGHDDRTVSIRAELEGLETTMGAIMSGDRFTLIVFALRYLLTRLEDL